MKQVKFEIKLKHKEPVDLIQMAHSLVALNNLAVDHIGKEHGIKNTKILLEGVREGSDIYTLAVDFGVSVLPIIEGVNTIYDFISLLNSYKNIDNKSIDEIKNEKHYNSINAKRVEQFIAPIEEHNNDSSLKISVNGNNNNVFLLPSSELPNFKNNVKTIAKIVSDNEEEESVVKLFEKVLLKMYQIKDTDKIVKDSAYCDEIVKGKAIATIIENKKDKKAIKKDPFENLYLVDIETVRADGEVKLYRVTKLHNIVPNED